MAAATAAIGAGRHRRGLAAHPQGQPLQNTGYRINLVAGDYAENTLPLLGGAPREPAVPHPPRQRRWAGRARLLGAMNVFAVDHLYLLGLRMESTAMSFTASSAAIC